MSEVVDIEVLEPGRQQKQMPSILFFLLQLYMLDHLLHLASRIPPLGKIRITLLLTALIAGFLIANKHVLARRYKTTISKTLNLLILYIIISIPLVTYPGSVLRENWQIFLKAVVFFYFISMIVDSPSRFKYFLSLFIVCQVFRVLEPLYLNITQGYWGSDTYLGQGEFANRLAGGPHDIINPNELGFVIATCVPFVYFLGMSKGFLYKAISAVVLVSLLYALILTMSRGAFLSLLVVAFIVFRKSNKKALLIAIAIGLLGAAWSVMTPVQKDRYLSLVDSDTAGAKSKQGRINLMITEFKLGLKRPIFGHGLGTTGEAKFHSYGYRQASHMLYGELLIELGFIGMIIYLRFLYNIYSEVKIINQFKMENLAEALKIKDVITTLFAMYLVYSLNYWGLSQSYWYILAGLTVSFVTIMKMQAGNDLYTKMKGS